MLALRQRADLFKANISANKISLPQGQSSCIALALRKAYFVSRNFGLLNKSALCRSASLAFSLVQLYTLRVTSGSSIS